MLRHVTEQGHGESRGTHRRPLGNRTDCGQETAQRIPRCSFVRSAGGTDGRLSGNCSGWRVEEQLASFGRSDLYELAAVCGIDRLLP
jgi:hypothetical protein